MTSRGPRIVRVLCTYCGAHLALPAATFAVELNLLDGRLEYAFTCPTCRGVTEGVVPPEVEAPLLALDPPCTLRDLPA